MTSFFSTAYTQTGVNQTSLGDTRTMAVAATDGGRVAYRRAYMDLSATSLTQDDDEIRFMRIKSGERPVALYLSHDAGFDAGITLDIGYAFAGSNHDGAVIFGLMHGAAIALDSGGVRTDIFTESTVNVDEDRGFTAWEISVTGGANYTKDPLEAWEVIGEVRGASGTGGLILLEMYYLPAGG